MSSYNYNGGGRQVGSAGGFRNSGILGVLQATQIDNKSVLPAEILFTILDHLPVPDLMRFARVSRLFREMVYDDTRWVSRLQSMGCWNEVEARRRFEEALVRRRRDTATAAAAAGGLASAGMVGRGGGPLPNRTAGAGGRNVSGSTTLFDAPLEEERRRQLLVLRQKHQEQQQQQQQQQKLAQGRDGFETLAIEGVGSQTAHATTAAATADKQQPQRAVTDPLQDTEALLDVLKSVRSIRGHAREEYGRVYGALAPFYYDLVRAKSHADPVVFKVFRDPERQARMLANLRRFAHSDWAQGWRLREERLATMVGIFEAAVLREFEQGYEFWDVDGRMNKYASVLDVLNGSTAGVDLFIHKHPLFSDREVAASNDMECLRLAPAAAAATAAVASAAAWGDAASVSGHSLQSGVEDIITLEPSRQFFGRLAEKVNEQGVVIGRIFPRPATVFWAFVDKVREDIVMEYITPLLDETHERSMPAYLTAVSGLFEQCLQFFQALEPPKGAEAEKKEAAAAAAAAAAAVRAAKVAATTAVPPAGGAQAAAMGGRKRADQTRSLYGRIGGGSLGGLSEVIKDEAEDDTDGWTVRGRVRRAKEMAYKTFEPHLDLYLQEELDFFRENAEKEVSDWDKKLSEQDASVESFFMANFNRQEVKKDFLSSFKKVVMMPVTVLPGQLLGGSSSSANTGSAPAAAATPGSSGTATPVPAVNIKSLPDKAPDDELAAKAALMATRLEGIRSLFSIEMALNMVHTAKTSLGRAAVFVQLDGRAAGEAREQCLAIFVELLRVLGNGHVKQGFDRAVEHLSQYNPRAGGSGESKSGNGSGSGTGPGTGEGGVGGTAKDAAGVAPLMTFIELVNVGDLISQMIDVFYEQQLAGPKIADRNDFLDAAGLAKKRFEQMIDESVAAGLNKGIDVLMDEVEYICATTQKPTDYYPEAADAVAEGFLFSLNGARASVIGGVGGGMSGGTSTPKSKRASSPTGSDISAFAAAASSGSGSGSGSGNSAFASASASASAGGSAGSTSAVFDIGPTRTALRVVELVRGHTNMLKGSTEKTMLEVFNGEVGLRLFTAVCKHLKRQRISMAGAVHVIADMTLYFDYVRTLRNADLLAYFRALRELSQLYLIDAKHHAKEMAVIIADNDRFGGVFRAEEVYEFAERRADWYQVKRDVERAMYGLECAVM